MSRQNYLHHDFETFSEINLKVHGTSRYARHSSTEALMCAYAFGDGEVKQWVPDEFGDTPLPAELEDGLLDERVIKFAWNKTFEWNIWKHVFGIEIPHRQWRDPMVLAHTLAMPGKLEKAGEVVGLDDDKKKSARGRLLIRKFTQPRIPTKTKPWRRVMPWHEPDDWEEFLAYNRQDVVAERAFWNKVWRYDLPAHEWELWAFDQEINEAGIPVNMNMCRNAITLAAGVVSRRMKRMVEITQLANPNSGAQLLPWLQDAGYPYDDLKKGHVARAAEELEKDIYYRELVEVLKLRLEVSKTSVKKYNALRDRVDEDGVLRNSFQFAAAGRTWRWGGRGYQAQNLIRPPDYLEKLQEEVAVYIEHLDAESFEMLFDYPMDVLATGVRPVVQAIEGYVFADADLNAIENRVLGWMAKCEKILDVFRNGRDPYVDFATYMYQEPYDKLWAEYKAGDKSKRTVAKPGVLGCGYQLSAGEQKENYKTGEIEGTGLLGYAWNMGIRKFTLEQAQKSVKVWRDTFKECVDYWYAIERAAKQCARTGKPTECWPVRFDREGPFLRMILPSGRALRYCRPRIEEKVTPWGAVKPTLTYEEQDERSQWSRVKTHGGKLTENADQAISRDLLAHGMVLAHKEGLDIRLHVHDQIVAMVPERQANWGLATLLDCMKTPPAWAPDIPLGAAGAVSRYFVKD